MRLLIHTKSWIMHNVSTHQVPWYYLPQRVHSSGEAQKNAVQHISHDDTETSPSLPPVTSAWNSWGSSWLFAGENTFVLSAKSCVIHLTISGRPFMKKTNGKGSRTFPWRIPLITGAHFDFKIFDFVFRGFFFFLSFFFSCGQIKFYM